MNKKPVSLRTIHACYAVGWTLIASAIGVIGYIIWWDAIRKPESGEFFFNYRPSPFDFWHWLVPLTVGVIVLFVSMERKDYWYLRPVGRAQVYQHEHVKRYTNGSADSHYLYVSGRNRQGKEVRYCWSVDAETWRLYRDGDYVNM